MKRTGVYPGSTSGDRMCLGCVALSSWRTTKEVPRWEDGQDLQTLETMYLPNNRRPKILRDEKGSSIVP
jgi:predicted Fe-S protein YdhL (DUF1289 family)